MTDEVEQRGVVRDDRGRWLVPPKGGRPKGLTNQDKIRLLLEPERDRLIGRMLELAFDNDPACRSAAVRATEAALSRIAPPPRQDSERVSIPGFAEAESLADKARCVIEAAASGSCSAEAASKLLGVLESYAKCVASTDHERRLAALEGNRAPVVIDALPVDGSDMA